MTSPYVTRSDNVEVRLSWAGNENLTPNFWSLFSRNTSVYTQIRVPQVHIYIEFSVPQIVTRFLFRNFSSSTSLGTFILRGSNDGIGYEEVKIFNNINQNNATTEVTFLEQPKAYKFIDIYCPNAGNYSSSYLLFMGDARLKGYLYSGD